MQTIVIALFSGMPKELITFFISMIPVIELKAALPVAILKFNLSYQIAFAWAVLGSTLMGIIIFVLTKFLFESIVAKINFIDKIWKNSIGVCKNRFGKKFEIVESIVIMISIAMPLPGLGSFFGALLGAFLRINFRKNIFYILWGNILSGIIVLTVIFGFKL